MLTPDYLLHISEGAEQIAEELHQEILRRIIERIMNRIGRGEEYILTATDKWQLEALQDAGYLLEDIQQEITKRTKLQEQEIREAMVEAGVKNIAYDNAIYESAGLSPEPLMQSPQLMRLMERAYKATAGEWRNFTRTTANESQRAFLRAVDKAYNLVTSGAVSYTQAVREAVNEAAAEGVIVTYPSGHKDSLETATLRAVRTGISQACGEITDARLEEMEWEIILVSSHLGARVTGKEDYTDHSWWQGKFYSRTGKDKRFLPFSVCGMGDVQGIHGANCRHSHGPGDGEHNPFMQYDSEENRKAYEMQQRQRSLERRIRNTKREVMALKTAVDNARDEKLSFELDMDYQKKTDLLQKQNQAYNDFCRDNNLKPLSDRIQIARWDRQQAAAARGAARRYESAKNSTLKNAAGQPIISVKTTKTTSAPNSITQRTGAKGGIDRNFYGNDGRQTLQISNNGHGHKKEEAFGNHGEHAHDYFWDKDGKATRGEARELTDQERKDNNDFL